MGGGREWADRRSAAARGDGQGGAGDRRAVCVAGGGEKGSRGLPARHTKAKRGPAKARRADAQRATGFSRQACYPVDQGLFTAVRSVRLVVYVLQLLLTGHCGHFGFRATHTSAPNSITA